MVFLTIGFHAIDVLLGIITHTWVVTIGANHNVFPILEPCPRVGTAAAVARKGGSDLDGRRLGYWWIRRLNGHLQGRNAS